MVADETQNEKKGYMPSMAKNKEGVYEKHLPEIYLLVYSWRNRSPHAG